MAVTVGQPARIAVRSAQCARIAGDLVALIPTSTTRLVATHAGLHLGLAGGAGACPVVVPAGQQARTRRRLAEDAVVIGVDRVRRALRGRLVREVGAGRGDARRRRRGRDPGEHEQHENGSGDEVAQAHGERTLEEQQVDTPTTHRAGVPHLGSTSTSATTTARETIADPSRPRPLGRPRPPAIPDGTPLPNVLYDHGARAPTPC